MGAHRVGRRTRPRSKSTPSPASINVTNYVAAHDVGRAINPFALEQQIEGGVVMALGAALTEQLLSDRRRACR